jgi:hypothetical protein
VTLRRSLPYIGYVAYLALAFLYFPAKVGFKLEPRTCEMIGSWRLALFSFTNYAHIVMLGVFFVLSFLNFSLARAPIDRRYLYSAIGTLTLGVLIEVGEGVSGKGHCRLRDLLPDSAGIALGAAAVALFMLLKQRLISQNAAT